MDYFTSFNDHWFVEFIEIERSNEEKYKENYYKKKIENKWQQPSNRMFSSFPNKRLTEDLTCSINVLFLLVSRTLWINPLRKHREIAGKSVALVLPTYITLNWLIPYKKNSSSYRISSEPQWRVQITYTYRKNEDETNWSPPRVISMHFSSRRNMTIIGLI